jgi:hypothetical protein
MDRIVVGISSLEQHEQRLRETPELYRPPCCPHCGIKTIWNHGRYYRKADLCHRGEANLNPVAIPRYCCSLCRRTCSRLPECIAPRRWYNFLLQQIGLGDGESLCGSCPTPARRTVGRWSDWLAQRGAEFRLVLTSRFPELGRAGDDENFWPQIFAAMGLSRAMAWCDRELIVP